MGVGIGALMEDAFEALELLCIISVCLCNGRNTHMYQSQECGLPLSGGHRFPCRSFLGDPSLS